MHRYWFGPPKYIRIAIKEAVEQAKKGQAEGGIPIGAVVLRGKEIIGRGHNRRLQNKDITAHGEIEAFRDAGEALFDPAGTTLITTLSPCRMCAGATQIAGIGHVIILDRKNYDDGQAEVLTKAGIKVEVRSAYGDDRHLPRLEGRPGQQGNLVRRRQHREGAR